MRHITAYLYLETPDITSALCFGPFEAAKSARKSPKMLKA
jgi:hypothetical protein